MARKQTSEIKSLNLIAVFGAALILALEVWNLFSLNRNHNYAGWVDHTHQVIETSDELLSTTVIAESWARGYVMAQDPSFLRVYYQSKDVIIPLINQLKRLTADDSVQQRRMDTLQSIAMLRLNHMDETIAFI